MRTVISVALIFAGASGTAFAQTWIEQADAGDLPGTAQAIPSGPLASIAGTLLAGSGNADLYLINIFSPTSFSALVVSTANTQLFLFALNGQGIAFNDDFGLPLFQSALAAGNPLYSGLPAGQYLLGISGSNNDPLSVGGPIFPDVTLGEFGPTGPGGALPLSSWSGGGAAGSYTIIITGVPPAPPSLGLLVLSALAGRRRRRT